MAKSLQGGGFASQQQRKIPANCKDYNGGMARLKRGLRQWSHISRALASILFLFITYFHLSSTPLSHSASFAFFQCIIKSVWESVMPYHMSVPWTMNMWNCKWKIHEWQECILMRKWSCLRVPVHIWIISKHKVQVREAEIQPLHTSLSCVLVFKASPSQSHFRAWMGVMLKKWRTRS